MLFLGRPFAHEIIITEDLATDSSYADFDGKGHNLPEVKQLTGLKLRYLPPGAEMPVPTEKKEVEKKEKKEKKEKEAKKEKPKKKKAAK